jgi:hypothetical protein
MPADMTDSEPAAPADDPQPKDPLSPGEGLEEDGDEIPEPNEPA